MFGNCSEWSRSTCSLTPWEVARRCRTLGGLAFLDSAQGGGFSLVAAAPFAIVEDWERLELQAEERHLAVGMFRYEGGLRFGLYRRAAVFEHGSGQWWQRGDLLNHLPGLPPMGEVAPLRFCPQMSRETYCRKVSQALEYIAAGDIYQANLSQQFIADWQGDAIAFYDKLRRLSPNPYAAYLEAGEETIFSASPELFLDIRGRAITTRPIKGTRPRGMDAADDTALEKELLASKKEAAELLMITDLERNDLGKVSKTGTVHVPELMCLERYKQVFHLVSTVTGQLRPDVNHLEAVRACFPGGSITGAPKKRAMEIIRELEPSPRGIYTGSIGCFGLGERSVFNIAIRTATLAQGKIRFNVGAGIVADSVPEFEYEETLAKAAGLLAAAR